MYFQFKMFPIKKKFNKAIINDLQFKRRIFVKIESNLIMNLIIHNRFLLIINN